MAQLTRAERRRRAREGGKTPPPPSGSPGSVHAGGTRRPRAGVLWWLLTLAVVVIAVGVGWWAMSPRAVAPAQDRPTIGERIPNEGFDHVPFGQPIKYRAHPPVSGPHYPSPAPAGVYPDGLVPGYWVHDLEHGYIVLVYRPPVSPELIRQFQGMVRTFPQSKYHNVKLVIAPYRDMPHPFAVLAWDWRLWMDQFDRAAVLAFYRAHIDHGREDLP